MLNTISSTSSWLFIVLIILLSLSVVYSYKITRNVVNRNTKLFGLGDMFAKALANDPNLPPAKNPGFTKEPDTVIVEFLPSKKTVKGFPGQKLSLIAQAGGVPIKYSCKKGECRTCEVNFNGKIVKACQASLPMSFSSAKITVQVPQK